MRFRINALRNKKLLGTKIVKCSYIILGLGKDYRKRGHEIFAKF